MTSTQPPKKNSTNEEKRSAPQRPPHKERQMPNDDIRKTRMRTVAPHARRTLHEKAKSTPLREHPIYLKTLAFFREYRQELPHNRLLYTPFLPLAVLLLSATFIFLFRTVTPSGADIYALVAAIQLFTILPPCTFYLRRFPKLTEHMGWKLPSPDKIAVILLVVPTLFFGAAALSSMGAYLGLTDVRYSLYTTYQIPSTTSMAGIFFSILTFAVIPAIAEEILCRGIIFAEYAQENTPLALLMSTVFFALLHFDISNLPVFLFVGLLLALLRLLTDSLPAVILARVLYNAACLFYEHFFGIMGNQLSEFIILFFLSAVICLIFLFFLFGEVERLFRKYASERQPTDAILEWPAKARLKSTLRVAWISPTLYFCIVTFVVFSIIF